MTVYNPGQEITVVAGEDLSSAKYMFVEINSSGQAELCDAATDKPAGVLQNAPASGEAATVMINGVSKIVLAGTVAAGAVVATSTAGKAQASVTGQQEMGLLLAGGAADEIGAILIQPYNVTP